VTAPGQVTRVIQINFAPAEDIVRVIQTLLHPGGQPGQPAGIIPDAPPMSNPKTPWWPLVTILLIYALWLAGLAFLAYHSTRWTPGQ
jgi:hypothetical protein